jgi:hypothetical protein
VPIWIRVTGILLGGTPLAIGLFILQTKPEQVAENFRAWRDLPSRIPGVVVPSVPQVDSVAFAWALLILFGLAIIAATNIPRTRWQNMFARVPEWVPLRPVLKTPDPFRSIKFDASHSVSADGTSMALSIAAPPGFAGSGISFDIVGPLERPETAVMKAAATSSGANVTVNLIGYALGRYRVTWRVPVKIGGRWRTIETEDYFTLDKTIVGKWEDQNE